MSADKVVASDKHLRYLFMGIWPFKQLNYANKYGEWKKKERTKERRDDDDFTYSDGDNNNYTMNID